MLENKYSIFQSTNSDSTRTANSSPNPYEKTIEKRIAIFDWDDTLFCTKYLETFQLNFTDIFSFKYSLEETNPYLLNQLKELENSIIQLFYEIVECNFQIFIVSNADLKWIENCLVHFFFDLNTFIKDENIKIYSAKNIFNGVSSCLCKIKCFKKVILDNFKDTNLILKILSIGDSKHEKKATLNLCKLNYYEKINVKFIQTIRSPSLRSIILQLNYIQENFLDFFENKNIIQKINIEMKGKNIFIKCNKEENEREKEEEGNNKKIIIKKSIQFNKKFLNQKRIFDL
jgi:hypothetical protein